MKLSSRIKFLVKEILCGNGFNNADAKEGVVYYDIGCDHGKIGCELLNKNATCKVVFCDISQINLNKAKLCTSSLLGKNFLNDSERANSDKMVNKLEQRCAYVCCDGVPNFHFNSEKRTYNIGLIFGLGGEAIKNIIKKDSRIKEFYLQPTTSVLELREYLYNACFIVIKDYLFSDGKKFYDFIHIKRRILNKNGKNENKIYYKTEEKLLGKDNFMRKDKVFQVFLTKQKHNLDKVLAKTSKSMLQLNIDESKIKTYNALYELICNQIEGE